MDYKFYIAGKANTTDTKMFDKLDLTYRTKKEALKALAIFKKYAVLTKDITLELKDLDTLEVVETCTIKAGRKVSSYLESIKVSEENKLKINLIFANAEGKASERCVDYYDVVNTIKEVESVCGNHNLKGVRVNYTGRRKFASAYKYTPNSTHFEMVNNGSSWRLISASVKRDTCPNNAGKPLEVKFPKAVLRAILNDKIGAYCSAFCKLSESDIID